MIRKLLVAIRRNKSIGPDGVSGELLKLFVVEVMITYFTRLLDITINSATIASDWKSVIVLPIYKGGNRSVVTDYRVVRLTSAVCKQMEHVNAGYLRQVWDTYK
jgi:hypothetical protein